MYGVREELACMRGRCHPRPFIFITPAWTIDIFQTRLAGDANSDLREPFYLDDCGIFATRLALSDHSKGKRTDSPDVEKLIQYRAKNFRNTRTLCVVKYESKQSVRRG